MYSYEILAIDMIFCIKKGGEKMTSNPVLVMVINMSIVFAVLMSIWLLISFVHKVDPTKNKK